MPFDVTILVKKIQGIKEAFENGNFADALVGAMKTGQGIMSKRIFNQLEDTQGRDFGKYIGKKSKARLLKSKNKTQNKRNKAVAGQELTSYQRKRALSGRQIANKDLQLTNSLRKSIELQHSIVKESNGIVSLEFTTDKAAAIARGQENQITNIRNGRPGTTKGDGVRIFRFTQEEKEKTTEQGSFLIKQILKPL